MALSVSTRSGKKTGKNSGPKTLLDAFERIVELSENSELNEEFFENAKQSIRFVTKKLNLSALQAVFLAICVDKSEDTRIKPSEIADYVGIRTIAMLKNMAEMEGLVEKHYLKAAKRWDDRTFSVPSPVLKALRDNQPYEMQKEPLKDTQEFFDRYRSLFKEKDRGEIDPEGIWRETSEMMEEIKDSLFVRRLRRMNLGEEDLMLFIFMAYLYVENNDDNIGFTDLEEFYPDGEIPNRVKRNLRGRYSELFSQNLIENVNDDGIARSDFFKLTDKAKEEILEEIAFTTVGKSDKGLINYENLAEKQLIYNDREARQLGELSAILSRERFTNLQTRLKESGMRQGFCCIFYGTPGTGKTESVYQIAKKTGRNILQVDVDKIKSCWIGESEKNIKGLFDRYRNICKNSEISPILLFNEADAVLGTRMEGASKAVDKMENSIQNIILQEMEKLDGIMIATTNLTSNLDKAFERRFLYKIKFDKPSEDSRAKIWKSMLPSLSDEQSKLLASRYNLSGGEIENVVRKHTVNSLLTFKDGIDMTYLEENCKLERLSAIQTNRVGF